MHVLHMYYCSVSIYFHISELYIHILLTFSIFALLYVLYVIRASPINTRHKSCGFIVDPRARTSKPRQIQYLPVYKVLLFIYTLTPLNIFEYAQTIPPRLYIDVLLTQLHPHTCGASPASPKIFFRCRAREKRVVKKKTS